MVAVLEPQQRTENQRHLHLVDGFSARVAGFDAGPRPRITTAPVPLAAPALDGAERVGAVLAAATYRRRRAVVFAAAALTVWLTVSTAVAVASWATGPSSPTFPASGESVVHLVQGGDTVWSIAREYQPTGDVRPFVDRLISLNGGSRVSAGQQFVISP